MSNQATAVALTREEASAAFDALGKSMFQFVRDINKTKRMRSLSYAEREMVIAGYRRTHEALTMLREKIGEAHSIGGY